MGLFCYGRLVADPDDELLDDDPDDPDDPEEPE